MTWSSLRTFVTRGLIVLVCLSMGVPVAVSQEDDPSGQESAPEVAAEGAAELADETELPPDVIEPEEQVPAGDEGVRAAWLVNKLTAVIASRPALARLQVGVSVRDPRTGAVLFAHSDETALNIASNAKLFTAAAALSTLGPEFRPRTSFLAEQLAPDGSVKGDLVLRGRADPTLSEYDLDRLVGDLVRIGVTKVSGKLVIDDSYFDDQTLPPHFDEQPKEVASFRAPISALSINSNSFVLTVTPNAAGTGPARVVAEPACSYLVIDTANVQTVTRGRTRVRLDMEETKTALVLRVTGQVRADATPRRYRRRIPDPRAFAAAVVRAALDRGGVRIAGKTTHGITPPLARVLVTRDGDSVAETIRALGKYSNNFYAEMLFKTLGAELIASPAGRPATWADAQTALADFISSYAKVPAASFRLDNGSGLFDASAISPALVTEFLAKTTADFRIISDLQSSLSIGGADGTVRSRLTGTVAERLVRVKTGTLAQVSALSGFAAADARRPLVFSVVVNGLADTARARGEARRLQDDIALAIVRYLQSEL